MTLLDRMTLLFEEAARHPDRDGASERDAEVERADWHPSADVFETDGEFVILLDLPGIRREALDVGLDGERLTIRGERAPESEAATQRRAERPAGRFLRSFTLPATVEREAITADYKDGVLRLRLPKRTEQQARRVEIKIS
jgi:HSP20 family protein